jgi:hypothetical protein
MAKWTLAHYNRFLGASMHRYSHSRKVAAEHYRQMRDKLHRSVTRADIRNHPRISRSRAEAAFSLKAPAEEVAKLAIEVKAPPIEIPEEVEEEFEDDEEVEFSEESP